MDRLLLFLNSIYPLSDALREYLQITVRNKKILKGTFLLSPPRVNREITFIQKGLLRAYYIKREKEVSSWFMKEGDVVVSISSFYDQVPTFEYIHALENTEVFCISYDELFFIYKTYFEFNFIGRELTTKYLKIWDQIIRGIRMNSAQERYEWLIQNHPEIVKRVKARYIASWLDITQVTLSKIKGQLNRRGGSDKAKKKWA